MTLARTCSECPNPLLGKSVKSVTCSDPCRARRSRRLRRIKLDNDALANQPGVALIASLTRKETPDVVKNVISQELAPIVRQALTEDVLRSIERLVGLTPAAVAALTEDLEGEDKVLRQRAYTLLFRYTAGHPALVKPEDAADSSQLVVHFNLPRPDVLPQDTAAEADELKTCDMCAKEKPTAEFELGSDRCTECFTNWKATIAEQFA